MADSDSQNQHSSNTSTQPNKPTIETRLNNNEDTMDYKAICISVFLSYASFSFDEKDFVISHMNLNRLFRDTNVIIKSPKVSSSIKTLTKTDIDIMIKKVRGKGILLNSKEYLNLIVLLSERTNHVLFKSNPKEAMNQFIISYLLPYYNKLTEPNSTLNENSVFSFHHCLESTMKSTYFDDNISQIFHNIHPILLTMHKSYFKYENGNHSQIEEIISQSLDDLILFVKEFDICPYLIEINRIVILFHLILEMYPIEITKYQQNKGDIFDNMHNHGKVFTLSKFSMMLVHLAKISFEKYRSALSSEQIDKCSNAEMLLLFLDKLQRGRGLECLKKRMNKPIVTGFRLIPDIEIIQGINPVIIAMTDEYYLNHKKPIEEDDENKVIERTEEYDQLTSEDLIPPTNLYNNMYPNESLKQFNYDQYLTIKTDRILQLYIKNTEHLKNVFEEFCSVGEKSKNHLLSFRGYLNFLRNFDIITNEPQVVSISKAKQTNTSLKTRKSSQNMNSNTSLRFSVIDSTLIFNKICSKNDKNEKSCGMNFAMFLGSFEEVAIKKFPSIQDKEEAIELFFKTYIQSRLNRLNEENGTRKEEILKVLAFIKEGKVFEVIKEIQSILYCIYKNYCDVNEFLSFNQFHQIYKDFGIFPNIINIIQIKNIFYSLSDLFKQQIMQDINSEIVQNNLQPTTKQIQRFNPILHEDRINFEIFCETLGISSLYTKSYKKNCNDVDKIFQLLQKMSQVASLDTILKNSKKGFSTTKEFRFAIDNLRAKYLSEVRYTETSDDYKKLLKSPTSFEDILND